MKFNPEFTLSEVERVLNNQGCWFNFNHGPEPETGLPVRTAEREITVGKDAVFFYFGKRDEPVSLEFLESACETLKIDRSVFRLQDRQLR